MVACQVFLLNRSPHLEALSTGLFEQIRRDRLLPAAQGNTLHAMQRAVAGLGFCDPPRSATGRHSARAAGGAQEWAAWADRWHATSTLTPRVRGHVRSTLLKVGRWLEAEHPEAADPARWTRQTCAAWTAALDRMQVGDYVQRTVGLKDRAGKPLEAATKATQLSAVRTFFRDCQEWEWIPRRFDPQRALATPRSIAALLGPDPRVIADEIWAKLMWAGLNLQEDDLPTPRAGTFYPFELVRAVTLDTFRAPYAGESLTAALPGSSPLPWPSPRFREARHSLIHPEGRLSNDAAGFASCYGPHRRSPERAFDAGPRPRPFPDDTASLLPGLLAATRTGLPPAGDDELTNNKIHHDDYVTVSPPALLGARKKRSLSSRTKGSTGVSLGLPSPRMVTTKTTPGSSSRWRASSARRG